MKTIINWTAGSFFRSIGRIIAYVVIGGFIAYLLNRGNFDWGRLIGIEKVSASTFTFGYIDNMYNSSGQSIPALPNYLAYNYIQSTNSENDFWFNSNHNDNSHGMNLISGINYIHFTVLVNPQLDGEYCTIGSSTKQLTGTWSNTSTGEGGSIAPIIYQYNTMECINDTNTFSVVMRQQGDNFNVGVPCSIYGLTNNDQGANFANVSCPVLDNAKWVSRITFFKLGTSFSVTYALNRTFYGEKPDGTNISNAINSQTQQQQQQYNDTNTTQESTDSSNYILNQQDDTPSGLTSAITSPLRILDNAISGTKNPLCFTLNGKQSCIPSGDIIWGRSYGSGNHWFDSGYFNPRDTFVSFFNIVVAGYLCYKMLLSMMRIFNNAIDPTITRIEVMKL